jgi:hypothetical protein
MLQIIIDRSLGIKKKPCDYATSAKQKKKKKKTSRKQSTPELGPHGGNDKGANGM